MGKRQALLLIDLQNDFCTGGALAVNDAEVTITVANRLATEFSLRGEPVIASLDWHPPAHGSFASTCGNLPGSSGELDGLPQIWWPDHCIQHSVGAALHPALDQTALTLRVYKGENPQVDSYSAFFDNGRRQSTALDGWLKAQQIGALTVMGLATDYCVKFSVLDALSLEYEVTVVAEGCRGVNLQPNDSLEALKEMQRAGAKIIW